MFFRPKKWWWVSRKWFFAFVLCSETPGESIGSFYMITRLVNRLTSQENDKIVDFLIIISRWMMPFGCHFWGPQKTTHVKKNRKYFWWWKNPAYMTLWVSAELFHELYESETRLSISHVKKIVETLELRSFETCKLLFWEVVSQLVWRVSFTNVKSV